MKVAINACFGGFNLSRQAERMLVAMECQHMKRYEPKEYFGGKPNWEEEFKKDQERPEDGVWPRSLVIEGMIINDDHRHNDGSRACPALVAVIETMGADANGPCAKLEVIEIPDGVDFVVEEYDGSESIHEKHRSWP